MDTEQLEVAKAECLRLEAELAELTAEHRRVLIAGKPHRQANRRFDAMVRERDSLARLHEVATERTVQLAAVIEKAKAQVPIGTAGAYDTLSSVDTDAALREVRAKALEDAARAIRQWDHLFGPDAFEWLISRALEEREGREAETDG